MYNLMTSALEFSAKNDDKVINLKEKLTNAEINVSALTQKV